MIFGTCTLPLSEKSKLTLPVNYRESLGSTAFVTQGFDRNLYLLSPSAFLTICSHLGSTSLSDPLSRLLRRLFLGGAVEIKVDEAGQIELPGDLCGYAGLGGEIIMVGQGEYSEIWSPAMWKEQVDGLKDHDANSNRFEKFHISLA
jgi:MraZ protein